MTKISVIIPMYNEAESADLLIQTLNSYFSGEKRFKAEVIFVNDGSTDDTINKLKTARHLCYESRLISFSRNFGSHAALRAGILYAKGDLITFMYADLQDPIAIIGEMFSNLITQQSDICWAFRNSTGVKGTTRLMSGAYARLMRRYAAPGYPQNGFDVVMFSRKVACCLNAAVEANSSLFIQLLNLGFQQTTIYYNKSSRKFGKSKWSVAKKIKLLIDSFVAFSYAPIRFVSIVGFLFFGTGVVWSVFVIVRKLFFNDLVSGWPTLIAVLTIGFGITNISLGILAEYLWRTLDASRNRPVFIIDEQQVLSQFAKELVVAMEQPEVLLHAAAEH